jgi:hypothetical protein
MREFSLIIVPQGANGGKGSSYRIQGLVCIADIVRVADPGGHEPPPRADDSTHHTESHDEPGLPGPALTAESTASIVNGTVDAHPATDTARQAVSATPRSPVVPLPLPEPGDRSTDLTPSAPALDVTTAGQPPPPPPAPSTPVEAPPLVLEDGDAESPTRDGGVCSDQLFGTQVAQAMLVRQGGIAMLLFVFGVCLALR